MRFSLLTNLTLVFAVSLSLLSGCSPGNSKNKSSESNVKTVDFYRDKNQESMNMELAEKFGLKNVRSVDIHYMNFSRESYDDKDHKKPSSDYLIFEKNLSVSNINLVNQILDSIYNDKKENKDKPFKEVLEINSDLQKIREGKMSPSKGTLRNFAGYAVYPGMKKAVPKEFDSNFILKDSTGKTVKIPFLSDSIGTYINYKNHDYTLSESSEHFIDNILKQDTINTDISQDVYDIAVKNNLQPSFAAKNKIALPDKFKEDVFGDGFKLFWENVNDILKTDESTKSGLDDYRGKTVTLEKYYIRKAKIHGLSRKYGIFIPEKDKSVDTDVWLVAIRNSDNKLLGQFLTSPEQSLPNARIDGNTLFKLTGKSYYQWLDNAFEDSAELKEIAGLSGENFIKKYYSMLNSNDENSIHLYLPTVSPVSGKVFSDKNTQNYKKEYVDNIKKAEIMKISKYIDAGETLHPESENYAVSVDFKFKEVITTEDGIDDLIVSIVKVGNNVGYRILEIGY